MHNQFINRVKIYNATSECYNTMFRDYKQYGLKLGFDKIMKQPSKLQNKFTWREKNWGCTSNALKQKLDADNTVFFITENGHPLNVFKMLSVMFNTIQVSLLSWSVEDMTGYNYLLENGETIKYNFITPEENESLYQQLEFYFNKNYLNEI